MYTIAFFLCVSISFTMSAKRGFVTIVLEILIRTRLVTSGSWIIVVTANVEIHRRGV